MTKQDYFDLHLPHRVNLMLAFRERYSGRPCIRLSTKRPALPWDQPRDFFRCSKDISFLMVRFFCDEMGLHLPERKRIPRERTKRRGISWKPRYRIQRFTLKEAKQDKQRFASLVAVLKAANRAVAHVDDRNVDHVFKERKDHDPLFDVIDWMAKLVQSHIYEPNGNRSLSDAMAIKDNAM